MNQGVMLKDYVLNSDYRMLSDSVIIKLSKELADDYDEGKYNSFLEVLMKSADLIDNLGLRYPGEANPKYYVYIIPIEKQELLNIPQNFNKGNGGGKPVKGFELDGFNSAYGITDNMCKRDNTSDKRLINTVHELTHLVTGMYINWSDRYISEGISEAVPYYVMNYEEIDEEHINLIANLNENDIKTAKELIMEEKDGTYGNESLSNNDSCSYRSSYVSSYLFVASLLDYIKTKYEIDRASALQVFYKLCKRAINRGENMLYEFADELNMDPQELIDSKSLQLSYINNVKGIENKKTMTK